MKEIMDKLQAPFQAGEIEWRVITAGMSGKPYAIIAPYVDARAVTRRLDEVFGMGWKNEITLTPEGAVCTLMVYVDGEWIHRTDGANYTKVEPVKGGISDALKRAAALYGIGKYLYYVPTPIFAVFVDEKTPYMVQIDGKRYYWLPPDMDLYQIAMQEYEAIQSGKSTRSAERSPDEDTKANPVGAEISDWESRKMKDGLPVIAVDYFRAAGYSRKQVADFCRELEWDNDKIIRKVDQLSSSF